jgi:predicted metal-dependent hydrolase
MASKKVVEIRGVGEVLLERSRRAKHFNLTIKPLNIIRVAVPPGVSFTDAELFARSKKQWLRKHLEKIEVMAKEIEDAVTVYPTTRKAARQVLVCRLNQLSEALGLPYNKVFVKSQKTRWGSCSMANNINLNVNLVRLPQELMDYAIIHELVHTKVKNHGKRFWDFLTRCLPDAEALDRELDRYWVMLGEFPENEES